MAPQLETSTTAVFAESADTDQANMGMMILVGLGMAATVMVKNKKS